MKGKIIRKETKTRIHSPRVIGNSLSLPWCLVLLAVWLPSLTVSAQPFAIDWYSIDGGGGTSTNGQYAVSGTIGQPDAGAMAGGNYTLQGGFWSLYLAIQTPGTPTLTIRRVGNNVEISWPVEGPTGFVLEETTSLNPIILWLNVEVTPTAVDGHYVVTLLISPGQHFFHLRKP